MNPVVTPPSSPRVQIAPRQNPSVRPPPIATNSEQSDEENEGRNLFEEFEKEEHETVAEIASEAISAGIIDKVNEKNYKAVISEINHRRLEAAKESEFELAQQCDDTIGLIKSHIDTSRVSKYQSSRYNALSSQLVDAENEYQDLDDRWCAVIAQAERNKQMKLDEIAQENAEELRELDMQYDKDPPKTFRKLSPKIIELRHTIRITAKSGNLREADKLKKLCDQLEEEELESHRKEWRSQFRVIRKEKVRELERKYTVSGEQLENEIIKMRRYKNMELIRAKRVVDHAKDRMAEFENSSESMTMSRSLGRPIRTAQTPRRSFYKSRTTGSFGIRRGAISKPTTPKTKRNRRIFTPA